MFEVLINNPNHIDANIFATNAQGGFNENGNPAVNPNRYITERVSGFSATVDHGNLIIIEGDGTVSAIYPTYQWIKATKIQVGE